MGERQLENKRTLVTGGRQGIGRAIVDTFASHGAKIITCGRGSRPSDLPRYIHWISGDLSLRATVDALTDKADTLFGTLDVVVNNAGIQIEKTIVETTDSDWDRLMGVNAKAVFELCRAFIPKMSAGGSIINLGSISARAADPGLALYNASKAFVEGLTRSIAVDHGPALRCNAISPGWIMTGMASAAFATATDPGAAKKDALARHPSGRFGRPEDVANLALWLAGDRSTFATGQCYTLDGGMTAASPINPGLY
ncbi:MAG: SDR family oxidoreductase [Gammaproteobacteria bacterium]|nr:SDR family oxidoreductase [Gammaproteobacteria bacterium]